MITRKGGLTLCCLFLCYLSLGEASPSGGGRTSGGSYSSGGSRRGGRTSGGSYSSGGSRSYSSSSGSRYNSYNSYSSGSSYGGGEGDGEAILLLAFILCIPAGVCVLLVKCCSMLASQECRRNKSSGGGGGESRIYYEGSITCYMCLNRIKNSSWDSDHRKRCFYGNKEEILSYPTPQRIFCPTCGDLLRLWPKKGAPFWCNNMDRGKCILQTCLPGGGGPGKEIVNTGLNRYNCFICDYDLCQDCVHKDLQDTAADSNPRSFNRVNSIKYNKYNFDPNSESAEESPKWELVGGAWRKLAVPSASAMPPSIQLGQSGLPYDESLATLRIQPHNPPQPSNPSARATSNPSSQGGLPYSVSPSAPLLHANQPEAPPSYFDAVRT